MDKPALIALEDHLKAMLIMAERANLSLVSYLLTIALIEVQERLLGVIKD
ncbi:hypothetical protein ACQZ45_03095 [Agrobacterium sp. 16-2014-1-2a]